LYWAYVKLQLLSSLYIVCFIKETELGMTCRTHGTDGKSVKTFRQISWVGNPWVIGVCCVMYCGLQENVIDWKMNVKCLGKRYDDGILCIWQ
jgi:hypothetical protein